MNTRVPNFDKNGTIELLKIVAQQTMKYGYDIWRMKYSAINQPVK